MSNDREALIQLYGAVCTQTLLGDRTRLNEAMRVAHSVLSTPPEPKQAEPLGVAQLNKVARVLADRSADIGGVDHEDNWRLYGHDFTKDAIACAEAFGLPGWERQYRFGVQA